MIKTVCICLPEFPDKIEAAKKHFEESGLQDVEFFWGINAEVAGLATWHTYERDAPGSGYKMGPKPTGIWLSHWMLLNHAMHTNYEHVMVLETDAKFLPGWKEKLDESLKIVPSNYDFLHIGHCCLEGFPRTHVGGDVYETKHAQCNHAYIVRRWCLPVVVGALRKCWAPFDIQILLECFPHLQTYAVIPRIVEQFGTIIPP